MRAGFKLWMPRVPEWTLLLQPGPKRRIRETNTFLHAFVPPDSVYTIADDTPFLAWCCLSVPVHFSFLSFPSRSLSEDAAFGRTFAAVGAGDVGDGSGFANAGARRHEEHTCKYRDSRVGRARLNADQLRTHSLSTPYLDSDMTSRWFDFGGDAIIRTDKYIRLAADMPSQSGWVWSRIPLTATNWEIEFEFAISGKGNLHGDGFALWVAKERAGPGPVFGSRDRFEGLGIFFDTYKNNRPGVVFPYVMGMMGDGKTTYDAANDGKANEIGGCSVWHLLA